MTRYRSGGQLDDGILTDGDTGYIGFDTRSRPTSLEPGITRFAQNMRSESKAAQPRKGIDRLTADLFTGEEPLTLSFDLGTVEAVSSITRSGSTATVTLSGTPIDTYEDGDTVEILGAVETDYNGEFLITVITTTPSATVFTYTVPGTPSTPATGTITATNHPVLLDASDGVFASTRFSDSLTNKEYVAQVTLDKTILINPDDLANPIEIFYPAGEEAEIFGSTDVEQVNDGLIIFRGRALRQLEWDGNISNTDLETVLSITRVGILVTVTTQDEHKYQTGDEILIAGADQADYNGQFSIRVTALDEFTYFIATTPVTPATGTITSVKIPQFKLMGARSVATFIDMPFSSFGHYHTSARVIVPMENATSDLTSLTLSGTTVTATAAFNHGLGINDKVEINGANEAEYNGTFEITNTTATTFDYEILGTPVSPDTSTNITFTISARDEFIASDLRDHRTYDPVNNLFRINRGKDDFLIGFNNFQNDNLIALYKNSINLVTGISLPSLENSSIFQITDEVGCVARKTSVVIGSRLLFLSEQGVYSLLVTPQINLKGQDVPLSAPIEDQINSLNKEVIDKAVATYFNNRYYLAVPEGEKILKNQTATTDGATVTVTTVKNHTLNEGDTITIAGMTPAGFNGTVTISLVSRNSFTYTNATVGPITVFGTSTKAASTRNNIIFVYNFLNQKWESIDTFGGEGSFIDDFVVVQKDGKDRLFITSKEGALQLYEELEDDDIGPVGGPFVPVTIQGQLITRSYTFDEDFDIHRYNRGSIELEADQDDSLEVTAITINPDTKSVLATYTFTDDNDHHRRFRIAQRGREAQIQIDTTGGRPTIRQLTIEGTNFGRSNNSYS